MKAFSIISNFELSVKPSWLDSFRERYDHPFPYHVTLKNTTYLENYKDEELIQKFQELLKRFNPVKISFKSIYHNLTKRGECIMIAAEDTEELSLLKHNQKQIHLSFKDFGTHIKPAFALYEANFQPHLTIGRYLQPEAFKSAWREVEKYNYEAYCEANINSVTLSTVEAENEREIDGTHIRHNFQLTNPYTPPTAI